MVRKTNPFHLTFFVCAALALGGCETMTQTWDGITDSLSQIDIPTPSPRDSSAIRDEEPRTAAVPTTLEPTEQETLSPSEFQELTSTPQEKQDTALISFADETDHSSFGMRDNKCPAVDIVEELSTLHQFMDMSAPSAANSISRVAMKDVQSTCTINDNNIVVDMTIRFEGTLGAAANTWDTERPSFAYPYFLAITAGQGNIVAKEVFGTTMTYDKGQTDIVREDNLRQIIPLHADITDQHEILLGFQLTDAELSYNRALLDSRRGTARVRLPTVTLEKPEPAQQAPVSITPPKPGDKPAVPVVPAVATTSPAIEQTIEQTTSEERPPVFEPDPTVTAPAKPPSTNDTLVVTEPQAVPDADTEPLPTAEELFDPFTEEQSTPELENAPEPPAIPQNFQEEDTEQNQEPADITAPF